MVVGGSERGSNVGVGKAEKVAGPKRAPSAVDDGTVSVVDSLLFDGVGYPVHQRCRVDTEMHEGVASRWASGFLSVAIFVICVVMATTCAPMGWRSRW
jgi:hypothetical protein